MGFTEKQVQRCLTPVLPSRIEERQGQSYVPQQEIRAELTRTFGVGNWDSAIHDVTLIYEDSEARGEKTYWRVCYRVACTLRIRDYQGYQVAEFTEYHAEECAPQPNRGEAHALALTSCESYALRRAAIGIGDNMGLHLYAKGSLAPLIRGTLQMEEVFKVLPEKPQDTLSDEQKAALQNSLGAVVVSEGPGEGTESTVLEDPVNTELQPEPQPESETKREKAKV